MIIFLDEALHLRLTKQSVEHSDIEAATVEGAIHRPRPKLMMAFVVILSLAPIFFENGIGADVMEPIAVPIVGVMVTSSIAVLILLPVLFAILKAIGSRPRGSRSRYRRAFCRRARLDQNGRPTAASRLCGSSRPLLPYRHRDTGTP